MRRLLAVGMVCALACAGSAQATMPGSNGKIAFHHDDRIWVVNPDGSGEHELSAPPSFQGAFDWSPDGSKIAFGSTDIYVINADGSGLTNVTNTPWGPSYEDRPSWSPDGTQIAYDRFDSDTPGSHVWIANADGTNQHLLSTSLERTGDPHWNADGQIAFRGCNVQPDSTCPNAQYIINPDGTGEHQLAPWGAAPLDVRADLSPDGTKVVYQDLPPPLAYPRHDLFVQNLDGTGQIRLTNDMEVDREPSWSPDGTKIVFRSGRGGNGPRIYTMNTDGSGLSSQPITPTAGLDPKWQPVHVSWYPRPKGATPMLMYLVPAYARCNAPNEQHGPPLVFGSCGPPVQASSALTVGTGDANGQPAKSVSTVLIESLVGNPATPADEADVRVTVNVNDVYVQGSLADYAGSLTVHAPLRITDKLTSGPGVAGTVADTSLDVPVSCTPTADTTVGSTCAVQTTMDTLIPGAVPEGKRSIWELGQVAVDDGYGAPFMKQGVFVP